MIRKSATDDQIIKQRANGAKGIYVHQKVGARPGEASRAKDLTIVMSAGGEAVGSFPGTDSRGMEYAWYLRYVAAATTEDERSLWNYPEWAA